MPDARLDPTTVQHDLNLVLNSLRSKVPGYKGLLRDVCVAHKSQEYIGDADAAGNTILNLLQEDLLEICSHSSDNRFTVGTAFSRTRRFFENKQSPLPVFVASKEALDVLPKYLKAELIERVTEVSNGYRPTVSPGAYLLEHPALSDADPRPAYTRHCRKFWSGLGFVGRVEPLPNRRSVMGTMRLLLETSKAKRVYAFASSPMVLLPDEMVTIDSDPNDQSVETYPSFLKQLTKQREVSYLWNYAFGISLLRFDYEHTPGHLRFGFFERVAGLLARFMSLDKLDMRVFGYSDTPGRSLDWRDFIALIGDTYVVIVLRHPDNLQIQYGIKIHRDTFSMLVKNIVEECEQEGFSPLGKQLIDWQTSNDSGLGGLGRALSTGDDAVPISKLPGYRPGSVADSARNLVLSFLEEAAVRYPEVAEVVEGNRNDAEQYIQELRAAERSDRESYYRTLEHHYEALGETYSRPEPLTDEQALQIKREIAESLKGKQSLASTILEGEQGHHDMLTRRRKRKS